MSDEKEIEKIKTGALLRSGKFYKHLDGSIVCRKCERTLSEGCNCWNIKVSICRRKR